MSCVLSWQVFKAVDGEGTVHAAEVYCQLSRDFSLAGLDVHAGPSHVTITEQVFCFSSGICTVRTGAVHMCWRRHLQMSGAANFAQLLAQVCIP